MINTAFFRISLLVYALFWAAFPQTVTLFIGCHKPSVEPLYGTWRKAFPHPYEPGFRFSESGELCRYDDAVLPIDSMTCPYTFTTAGDSVVFKKLNGTRAFIWKLEWISEDFIRVRQPNDGPLVNVFYLERQF